MIIAIMIIKSLGLLFVYGQTVQHDLPGEDYAGWRAHYTAWHNYLETDNPPDMIGFFAYRYYLWDPSWFPLSPQGISAEINAYAPNWLRVPKDVFDNYRSFLSTWDGDEIKEQFAIMIFCKARQLRSVMEI